MSMASLFALLRHGQQAVEFGLAELEMLRQQRLEARHLLFGDGAVDGDGVKEQGGGRDLRLVGARAFRRRRREERIEKRGDRCEHDELSRSCDCRLRRRVDAGRRRMRRARNYCRPILLIIYERACTGCKARGSGCHRHDRFRSQTSRSCRAPPSAPRFSATGRVLLVKRAPAALGRSVEPARRPYRAGRDRARRHPSGAARGDRDFGAHRRKSPGSGMSFIEMTAAC